MRSEYYSTEVKEYFYNLNKNIDTINNELFFYLKTCKDLFYVYIIIGDNINFSDKYFNGKIFKENKDVFNKWFKNNNSPIKTKSIFLALNASNSLKPNHTMRYQNKKTMAWEDCVDFDNFFKETNKLTFSPYRYGFAITFIKPGASVSVDPTKKGNQPYIFSRLFLLNNTNVELSYNNEKFLINQEKRDFVYYNQINLTAKNTSDETAIILGSSYFMFEYDIKNYFYFNDGLDYQSPKAINYPGYY